METKASIPVRVLFFSFAAERMNARDMEVAVAPGTRIADLFGTWADRLGADASHFAFAVNETWQPADYILKAGDVLAVIPPVAGG
jgi:molybdopterin converting factor small subunit